MKNSQFIYAVIKNNGENPLLTGSLAGGIDGAPLDAVCYRDLAAVVSSIDSSRFDPVLQGDISPAQRDERLKADMLRYQQVNSFLLEKCRSSGILPLRFGFTAKDKDEIPGVLELVYILLRTYLERLKGKAELVVQASWELPRILQEIARDDPKLVSADPVQTGRMLFEAAEAKKKQFVDDIHDKLHPFSRDFSDGPFKGQAMVLNRSYLVEQEKEPLFDEAIDALGTKYDGYLAFRYIGPLPGYSFANIELNQGNFALVDKARRTLQLPEKASWEQIRSSYRMLIMKNHPDRNPDRPQAEACCKDLVAAYEIVSAYCQSFGECGNQVEYSFVKEDVERVFILDTKGA